MGEGECAHGDLLQTIWKTPNFDSSWHCFETKCNFLKMAYHNVFLTENTNFLY